MAINIELNTVDHCSDSDTKTSLSPRNNPKDNELQNGWIED